MTTPILSDATPLLLGSGSPRRLEILRGLGLPLIQRVPQVDEQQLDGEGEDDYLRRVVQDKLRAAERAARDHSYAVALAADTIVVCDTEVLGKPADAAEAERHLRRLVGRSHVVKTCYALAARGGASRLRIVSTEVEFRAVSELELRGYADSGEGLDKAGAYAAQGIGSFLIRAVRGSYSNVVGLPAAEVIEDLAGLGVLGPYPRSGSGASA